MAPRLVEIRLPQDQADTLDEVLAALTSVSDWDESRQDGYVTARLLLDAEQTGAVIDAVDDRFGSVAGFRLLVLTVEATLPRREEEPTTPAGEEETATDPATPPPKFTARGISREELFTDIEEWTRLTYVFVAMVILSVIVASVGILRANSAIIIGAMVIAPLLGPNVALAFGATLGDVGFIRKSLLVNVVGIALALGLAAVAGMFLRVDPLSPEVAPRTVIAFTDLLLALAAGTAGVLALTTGAPTALVGVMVAVALLPPTVVLGLLLGVGEWKAAGGAGMLLATNIICINLAGVATFLVQGVRPRTWWEADRARRSARIALGLSIFLMLVLSILIVLGGRG